MAEFSQILHTKLGLKMIRLFLRSSHLLYLNLFSQYSWEKNAAREAWKAINRNFSGKSKSRIMELQTRLHNLRKDTMSVDDYVQLVRSLGDEL